MSATAIPSDTIPLGGKSVDVSSVDATFTDTPQGFIRGFYVSAAGNVKVDFAPGYPTGYGTLTIVGCVPGVLYTGRISKIYTSGTTNTNSNIMVVL